MSTEGIFFAASIPAKPGEAILEIGTGNGTGTIALAKQVADLKNNCYRY